MGNGRISFQYLPVNIHLYGIAHIFIADRKSTRLNSSHANIYSLSLHDALPIYTLRITSIFRSGQWPNKLPVSSRQYSPVWYCPYFHSRSEEHTSELQSRQYLLSFPTRRSSDLYITDNINFSLWAMAE